MAVAISVGVFGVVHLFRPDKRGLHPFEVFDGLLARSKSSDLQIHQ